LAANDFLIQGVMNKSLEKVERDLEMMKLKVFCVDLRQGLAPNEPDEEKHYDLEYDVNDGIETLEFQILSMNPHIMERNEQYHMILIDFLGREIKENEDLGDLQENKEPLDLYCIITFSSEMPFPYCTSIVPRNDESAEVLQPKYDFADGSTSLCENCRQLIDPSLISLSPSQELQFAFFPFQCQIKKLTDIGLILPEMSNRVKVPFPEASSVYRLLHQVDSPIQLYNKRLFFQKLLNQQRNELGRFPRSAVQLQQQRQHFLQRMQSGIHVIKTYEDPSQQQRAMQHLNFDKINEYLEVILSNPEYNTRTIDEQFFLALLQWFKLDFFKWCNKPSCDFCEAKHFHMEAVGMDQPNYDEKTFGWASRVECYKCTQCQKVTRFPRYNNPAYMMENSRRGRCGEFANVFGLICRTLGFDVNYILDWTDHVWVEVWNPVLKSYIHVDSCERSYNSPLMYEVGWQKKLSHVLSFNIAFIHDAIPRYTRSLETIIVRRNSEILLESEFLSILKQQNKEMETRYVASRNSFPASSTSSSLTLLERVRMGKKGFENIHFHSPVSLEEKHFRSKKDLKDLEQLSFYSNKTSAKLEELQGRISGDLQWRKQRGEIHDKDLSKNETNMAACTPLEMKEDESNMSAMQLCASDVPLSAVFTRPSVEELEKDYKEYNDSYQSLLTTLLTNKNKSFSWMFSPQGNFINGIQLFPSPLGNDIHFQFTFMKYFPTVIPNERIMKHFDKLLLNKRLMNIIIINDQITLPFKLFHLNFFFLTETGNLFQLQKPLINFLKPENNNSLTNLLNYLFLDGEFTNNDSESQLFHDILAQTNNGLLIFYSHHNKIPLEEIPDLMVFLERFSRDESGKPASWKNDKECFCFFPLKNGKLASGQSSSSMKIQVIAPSSFPLTLKKNNLTVSIPAKMINCSFSFNHSLSQSSLPIKFHLMNDCVACNPSEISFPTRDTELQNLSDEKIMILAKEKCLQNPAYLGFTVIYDSVASNNSLNRKIEMIWHFTGNGIPLKSCPQTMTFMKKIEKVTTKTGEVSSTVVSSEDSNDLISSVDCVSYYFLGGESHSDTISFNSLESLLPMKSSTHPSEIILFAGEELVNGIQMKYRSEDSSSSSSLKSNKYSSSVGNPQAKQIALSESIGISQLNCQLGALVDRIEVITRDANNSNSLSTVVAGGNGGGRYEIKFDPVENNVNASKELMGFFGGTGGHLHNMGIICREHSMSSSGTVLTIGEGMKEDEQEKKIKKADSGSNEELSDVVLGMINELELFENCCYFHSIPLVRAAKIQTIAFWD
jgi:hypothetical protein